jgi:hypothetical protein
MLEVFRELVLCVALIVMTFLILLGWGCRRLVSSNGDPTIIGTGSRVKPRSTRPVTSSSTPYLGCR